MQQIASQTLTLIIRGVLRILTTTLAEGCVGKSYTATLAADGGVPPYAWTLKEGTLPAGLSLSSDGKITGTPSAEGTYTFTVQVADSGA